MELSCSCVATEHRGVSYVGAAAGFRSRHVLETGKMASLFRALV